MPSDCEAFSTANQTSSYFFAAVRGDKGIQRKAIVAIVRVRDGSNLRKYRAKTYEAEEAVIIEMTGE